MSLIVGLIFFILGCAIGSFLNVLIDRIPRGESVLGGRSHCEKCKKELAWYDLIPVVSFILIRAKCRYCKSKLSYYYPFVEILTGLVFLLIAFLVTGLNIQVLSDQGILIDTFYLLFLLSSLIVIFFTDLKYGIIPFIIVFLAFNATLIWYIFTPIFHFPASSPYLIDNLLQYFLSAAGVCGFFLALFFITKGRGMGFGDVVYAFLMGFLLGFPRVLLGIYIAFVVGAIVALSLVLSKKKKLKGGTVPFGPFLVLGTIVAFFWGQGIINFILPYITLL